LDLLTTAMHELGHVLGYGHAADGRSLMSPVLSVGRNRAGSSAGSSAEAVKPLGQAEWRMGLDQWASDALFADLADDGLTVDAWFDRLARDDGYSRSSLMAASTNSSPPPG
jgi:hypothetical protein